MKRLFPPLIKLGFACCWLLTNLMVSTIFLVQPIKGQENTAEPQSPKTGTPKGSSTPGTTRPPLNCPETLKPLTAIFANNGSDFTSLPYPTFWFYIPYNSQQISYMEFLLIDTQKLVTVYHTAVKLSNQQGIISISIPPQPQYALKVHQNYRWRFNLICKVDTVTESNLVVKGWIRRLPITSQLANQLETSPTQKYSVYQNNGIWYDAIANLAELHFANLNNQQLSVKWIQLLEFLDQAWVSDETLVNSEVLPAKD